MTNRDGDRISATLHLGLPVMEVGRPDGRGETHGTHITDITWKEGSPPTIAAPEAVRLATGGEWTVLSAVDDEGCVPRGASTGRGSVGTATITKEAPGLMLATDRRLVGMIGEVPALGITPRGRDFLLVEIPYSTVTSIDILRRRKGSGFRPFGFALHLSDGMAFGALACQIVDELALPSFRPRKVRDIPGFLTPLVSAIFDHRISEADPAYAAELQEARQSGWVPDPDDGENLVAFIPERPSGAVASTVDPTPAVEPPDQDDSSTTEPDLPAAGWYDDPDNAAAWRYWTGEHWTESYAHKPSAAAPGGDGS